MSKKPNDVVLDEFRLVVEDVFTKHLGIRDLSELMNRNEVLSAIEENSAEGGGLICTSIGLEGSERINASLYLVGVVNTFTPFVRASETAIDWLGELTNLLMGRLKNKLSEYNVRTKLGLPVEETIQTSAPQCWQQHQNEMKVGVKITTLHGSIFVLLHYTILSDETWTYDQSAESAESGSICLF